MARHPARDGVALELIEGLELGQERARLGKRDRVELERQQSAVQRTLVGQQGFHLRQAHRESAEDSTCSARTIRAAEGVTWPLR